MAFEKITGAWLNVGANTGDDGTLTSQLGCLTDGVTGTSCDEYKSGESLKIEIPFASYDTGGTMQVRFFLQDAMTTGNGMLAPYTDSNSISTTNELTLNFTTDGQWYTFTLTTNFVNDLGDVSGKTYMRLYTTAAKLKISEVEYDITEITYTITPEPTFYDADGNTVSGAEYMIYRVESENPMVIAETPTQTGTTDVNGNIDQLALGPGDYVILYRDHNATEADALVDMSHIFTVSAP